MDINDICPLVASGSDDDSCNFFNDPGTFTVSIETAYIEVSGYGTKTCSFSSFAWYVDDVLLENQTGYSLPIAENEQVEVGSVVVVEGIVDESSASRDHCDASLNNGYEYHSVLVVE